MRLLRDISLWSLFWIFILSGAARAAFDGALIAYVRPQYEQLSQQLTFLNWIF